MRAPRLVSAAAASTLLLGLAPAAAPAHASPAPVPAQAPSPAPGGAAPEQRETLLAAQIAARNSGRRVEATGLRTETTTTYADPAGTVTTESAPAPIRARDASGKGWAPVDLRLEGRDGHLKPRSAPGGLTFSIGGNDSLVGVGPKGRRFSLRWPARLPEPRVEGSTAVYPDVDPGVDLVMEAERSGFEQSFTVKQRQNRQLVYRMPLGAAGMRVEPRAGGGFRLLDSNGAVVGEIPRPVMYDAQRDPVTRDPVNVRLLDVRIVNSATGPVMQVMPDRAWLDDPATRYPVTLDPSVHLGQLQDTWVASNTSTQTFYTATDLRSGKYGGTGAIQRSLLQFDPGPIRGTNVLSATLALYNNQSASCDQSKVTRAYALAGPFDANTTYANRPGVDSTIPFTTTTGSKAGPTCTTPGFLRWDVLGAAKKWATGATAYGVTVLAADEADTANWKRYASADNGDNRYVPSLAVTYNSYPITPDGLAMSPGNRIGDVTYVNTTSPTLRATGYDPDGGTVQLNFQIYDSTLTTQHYSGTTGYSAQGTPGSLAPPAGALRDGGKYLWRVRTYDGTDYSGWTGWQSFEVDTTPPGRPTPRLSSSSGSKYTFAWPEVAGASGYRWGLDGQNPPNQATPSPTSVTVTADDGAHEFHLTAVDRAGNVSPVGTVGFNQDVTTLSSPYQDTRTGRFLPLGGTSRLGWDSVTYQYGDGSAPGWRDIPSGPDGAIRDTDGNAVSLPVPAQQGEQFSESPELSWDVAKTLARADGTTRVRVCFIDSTGRSCSPVTVAVTLDQAGLGDTFAAETVGPGRVSLLNGNYALTEDDVEDGSGTTSLTVSRTFNSRTPDAPPAGSMFGPGWLGSLPVDTAGADYVALSDRTGRAAGITVTTSDGSTIIFAPGGAAATDSTTGERTEVLDATGDDAGSGATLTKRTSADGAVREMVLADLDGNRAFFTRNGNDPAGDPRYLVARVEQPGTENVTYAYDSGRLIRAVASKPNGANCTDTSSVSTFTVGCRALDVVYDTVVPTRAAKIQLVTHDDSGALLRLDVSCYEYRPDGRLGAQYDPRYEGVSTSTTPPACGTGRSLVTTYDYDSQGRLAAVTPPGLAPWRMSYDDQGRLAKAERSHEQGNADRTETTSIRYDIPLAPASDGRRPDLRPAEVARWAQDDAPVSAAAVFAPGDTPGADPDDLREATVVYMDNDGYPVNRADYASGWRIATAEHDDSGRVVRSLTASNRELALNPGSPDGQRLGLPTDTAQAARWLDTWNEYAPTSIDGTPGVELLDTYGPYREVVLPDGRVERAREHTHYGYTTGQEPGHPDLDPDLPGKEPLRLEKTRTVAASLSPGLSPTNETDVRTVETRYALTDANGNVTDDTGFKLRLPMMTIEDNGDKDRVTVLKYDPDNGLLTEKWMPGASDPATGDGDAQKTRTVYYKADPQPGVEGCVDKRWAKLPCRVEPVAQPNTAGVPPLPVRTFAYDHLLRPATVTETVRDSAGTQLAQRTSTTRYDNNGWAPRLERVSLTSTSGVAVPDVEQDYDPSTGLPTETRTAATAENPSGTVRMRHDDFGRQTEYTDADGNTATTAYSDNTGRVTRRTNARGTVDYTYEGGDDRRGLPTGMTVSGLNGQFTAAYDADGQLAKQTWPNGMTQTLTRDTDQELVGLADRAPGQAVAWLEHTVLPNVHSQWRTDQSTTGSGGYAYDGLRRLTTVTDRTAPAVAGGDTCTSRAYTYDIDSNRLAKHQRASGTSACPAVDTTSTDRTQALVYDPADRLLPQGDMAGLAYDDFGRVTELPGEGTSSGGHAVRNTYWANDLVRAQNSTDPAAPRSTAWTLDPQLRPRTMTDTGSPDGNANKTHHYDDTSDSPSWIDETNVRTADGAPTAWTRYVEGFNGDLTLSQTQDGTFTYQLVNLHGDVTAKIRASTTSGPEEYFDADEFGNPQAATSPDGADGRDPDRYTWLGGKQRSNQTAGGLILMGVRLYAPALGRFLQVDPISGGGENDYGYPTDPVNVFDLDGRAHVARGLGGSGGGGAITGIRLSFKPPVRPTRPKTTSTNKRRNDYAGSTVGYTIMWNQGRGSSVYKYGISANGLARANMQIARLNKMYGGNARFTLGFTRTFNNKASARAWESSSVINYYRRHGSCPPGQIVSCR